MKQQFLNLILAFLMMTSGAIARADGSKTLEVQTSDVVQLETRMKEDVLSLVPIGEESTFKLNDLNQWIAQYDFTKGYFLDLDYVDPNVSSWGPLLQLERFVMFSLAYQLPNHPFYHDSRIVPMINRGIEFWISKQFYSANWWMNEIGVTLRTYKIYFLMASLLKQETRNGLIHLTRQAEGRSSVTGQNLVWYSELYVALGVMLNEPEKIKQGIRDMRSTLEVGIHQGIKADQSFWQHGEVFYPAGYGLNFSYDLSRFVKITRDTPMAFDDLSLKTLTEYMLDGQAWLLRGQHLNYSAGGRWFARPGYNGQLLATSCENMATMPSARQAEFSACAHAFKNGGTTLNRGNKHFWHGDFMIQQQDQFTASVKLLSKRLLNADTTPNTEGYMNDYLADGAQYIFKRGDEYKDIFPVWDFRKVPGITAVSRDLVELRDVRYFGTRSFVGGVSDGKIGLAAMDFERGQVQHRGSYQNLGTFNFNESKLVAKKSWFFLPRGFVALGAGITHTGRQSNQVWTTLNQTWSKSAMTYEMDQRKGKMEDGSVSGLLKWVHHDDTAYVMLTPQQATIQNTIQTGNWRKVSGLLSSDPVQGKVFSAWIEHGLNPVESSYAYAVFPGVTAAEASKLAKNTKIEILVNQKNLQAIRDMVSGTIQIAFYEPGIVKIGDLVIESQDSVLVMLSQDSVKGAVTDPMKYRVTVSNPENKSKTARLKIQTKQASRTIDIKLPDDGLAGSSVTENFVLIANAPQNENKKIEKVIHQVQDYISDWFKRKE